LAPDSPVLVGGIIPKVDTPRLKEAGISGVFPAGTRITDILDHIRTVEIDVVLSDSRSRRC